MEVYLYDMFVMGIGDWGLGIGDWGLGPIPNPQSPIPNPQSPFHPYSNLYFISIYNFIEYQKINIFLIYIHYITEFL